MNNIPLSEILKIDNLEQLDKTITTIESLSKAIDVMLSSATGKLGKYAEIMQQLSDASEELEKQVVALDAAEKDHQDTIAKSAAQSDKMLKEQEQLNDGLRQTEKEVLLLNEQIKKLTAAKEKLNKAQEAEVGSIAQLKDELKKVEQEYIKYGSAMDQATKEERLKKITQLSQALREQEDVLKEAKKAADVAEGSYKQLEREVNAAKNRLKEMKGGLAQNSDEFRKLQKFVKDGSKQLKEFDDALGDARKDSRQLDEIIDILDNRFGGFIGTIKQTGKELLTLATNPYFLIIAGVIATFALATKAVTTFFRTTGEGEDELEKQIALFNALGDSINKALSNVGKGIFDAVGGEDATIKIIDTILEVAKSLPVFFLFRGFLSDIQEEFRRVAKEAIAVAEILDELGDKVALNVLTRAQRELAANKLLEDSRNRLKFTDEERLKFVRQAAAIQETVTREEIALQVERLKAYQRELLIKQKGVDFLKQQIKFDAEGLALIKKQIAESDLLGEQKEKLAADIAAIINLESQYYQQQRRNNAQIIALTEEIARTRREREYRRIDTQREIDKFIYDAEARRNDRIMKDEDASLEERLNAVNAFTEARISALEVEKARELDTVQRAAEDRIRAEGKQVTAELLALDEGLQNQRELIMKKYLQLIDDANREALDLVENNVFKQLKRDADELNADTQTTFNNLNRALEASFREGDLTLNKLLQGRAQLQQDQQQQQLKDQIDYFEAELALLEQYGHDTSAIEAKLSAARLALEKKENDQIVDGKTAVRDAVIDLAFQTFQTVSDIINAQAERQIMALESELAREEEAKDRSIAIVGEDAQAKEFIEAAFAERQAQIQRQINEQKRKAAIFDKAVAITQATVQTALGVTRALGSTIPPFNFILAALVGAAGALQIASIASQPIPQFFKGTSYSPEGLAFVGERGRELIISPSGETSIAEGPQVRYLERGSQVLTNAKTEALLRDGERFGDGYLMDQVLQGYNGSSKDLQPPAQSNGAREIVHALGEHKKDIIHAIRNMPQDIYDEKGHRRYENAVGVRIRKLNKRFKLDQ